MRLLAWLSSQDEIDEIYKKIDAILNAEFEASKAYIPRQKDWLSSHWCAAACACMPAWWYGFD